MSRRSRADRPIRKLVLSILVALPLLGLIAASIAVGLQWHQDDLDHRLIQAITRRQTSEAISLLNHDASANARDTPYTPLTLRALMSEVWARLSRRKLP